MDIAKAFTFITEDEGWIRKLGIGTLMGILGFLILPVFILAGYGIAIARNVMQGDKKPLPEWTDLGKMLADGLIVTLATLVYALPMILLVFGGVAMAAAAGAFGEGGDAAAVAGGGVFMLLSCVAVLYGLAVALITPAIYVQYIRHGSFGSCFQFGEIMNITRSQIGNIVISIVALIGVSLVLSIVLGGVNIVPCLGQIVSVLGLLVMAPYMQMVTSHLYGQIASLVDGGVAGSKESAYDNL